ncbi:hypothetical protein CEN46_01275 [Fischerella thermalis CCMEE 5318]|uniref:Uncharacterized protein n=1 Tax=Fischerella thermalis CCMEE 5318 TaxID=2019666 RepID=A0A2N6LP56_9CYAN|nr:hypothetical protein CEN46_01275 [Fischerella thermalis CCMEE 5318]
MRVAFGLGERGRLNRPGDTPNQHIDITQKPAPFSSIRPVRGFYTNQPSFNAIKQSAPQRLGSFVQVFARGFNLPPFSKNRLGKHP